MKGPGAGEQIDVLRIVPLPLGPTLVACTLCPFRQPIRLRPFRSEICHCPGVFRRDLQLPPGVSCLDRPGDPGGASPALTVCLISLDARVERLPAQRLVFGRGLHPQVGMQVGWRALILSGFSGSLRGQNTREGSHDGDEP